MCSARVSPSANMVRSMPFTVRVGPSGGWRGCSTPCRPRRRRNTTRRADHRSDIRQWPDCGCARKTTGRRSLPELSPPASGRRRMESQAQPAAVWERPAKHPAREAVAPAVAGMFRAAGGRVRRGSRSCRSRIAAAPVATGTSFMPMEFVSGSACTAVLRHKRRTHAFMLHAATGRRPSAPGRKDPRSCRSHATAAPRSRLARALAAPGGNRLPGDASQPL